MIRIAITAEAFDAVAKTLPVGSVGYEAEAMSWASAYLAGGRDGG